MKKPSFLHRSLRSSPAGLLVLGLAVLPSWACSHEEHPAAGGASSAVSTQAAAPSSAAAPEAGVKVAAESAAGSKLDPSQDPANHRGGKRYEGGIETLDSNYDLSKVKAPAAAGDGYDEHDGHDHGAAPADGSALLPEAQAQTFAGRFELTDGAQQVKDFGKLRQGDTAAYAFPFVSNGKDALIVTGIKPSCGCTKADVVLVAEDGTRRPYTKGDPIPVGTKFELETEINTDGRQGPFNSQVSLYANDSRGAFVVRLTAEVEPVLTVTPSPTVFFGKITTKDRVEQTVTVRSTRGEAFLLELAQEEVQEPVDISFVAKNPDEQGKSNEWDVKVALGPSPSPGMRHYPINLKSDLVIANPKYASADGSPQYHGFLLNLQAQVVGMVSAEPPFLTFGMVKPGETIERALRLECHDEFKLTAEMPVVIEGLQAQELPWGDRFKVTITPVDDGKAADVKVLLTGLPEDVNGSIGGQIRILVGHPNMEEVALRFSAVCRPGLPPVTPQGGQQK